MYEYLVERFGARAPLDLMDRYAKGVREEAAFAEVCGLSREQFMNDFKPWAKAQLMTWGMMLDDALPSLKCP